MLKKKRLSQIMDMLDEHGILNVSDLAVALDVSEMTVRRDLDELENHGRLLRFHGGAQSIDLAPEKEEEVLAIPRIMEKRQIARAATELIHSNEVVFLGSGSTVGLLARFINLDQLMVVTNSFQVFKILSRTMPEKVILTGGLLDEKSGAFIGSVTTSVLKTMKFSIAFVGCSGIQNEDVMVGSMEEGEVEKIALDNSRRKILLADHSKFNNQDFFVMESLPNLDLVITDDQISEEDMVQYSKYTNIKKSATVSSLTDNASRIN